MDVRAVGREPEQELGFGDDLIADVRDGLRARERRPPAANRDLEPQPVAGHDLAPELRVVHAAQVDPPLRRAPLALEQENRRHLGQRFEHQHAGQRRRPREVPLKEFFVDGDVLDGHEPPARLVLDDRVDEHRRIPVAQPVQEERNVDHAPTVWARAPPARLGPPPAPPAWPLPGPRSPRRSV